MGASYLLCLVLYVCSAFVKGQQVLFKETDFHSSGNITRVLIVRSEANDAAINITVTPMTINQYIATGKPGCLLSEIAGDGHAGNSHAEAEDFNNTVLHVSFPPSQEQLVIMEVDVGIHVDDVVEDEEVFVLILEVAEGTSGATIERNCTFVRINDQFSGQFLRWTRNGEVVNSTLSLSFPEMSGSHLLITAERLVPTVLTTEIMASINEAALTENVDFRMNRTYSIPPETSSVNITIDIIEDNMIENDETMTIRLTARASRFISGSERTRTIIVSVLDDEVLNYTFLNTSAVINITEGESVRVSTGIDPITTVARELQLARITSENGSALEGVDFEAVDQQIYIVQGFVNSPTEIRTIFRPGTQPTRTFTVRLLPDGNSNHPQTHISGTLTINIIDEPDVSTTSMATSMPQSTPQPPVTSQSTPLPPVTSQSTPLPPVTSQSMSQPPVTFQTTSQPPVTFQITPQPSVTSQTTPQTPVTRQPTPQTPATSQTTPQPQVTSQTTPQPPVTRQPTPQTPVTSQTTPQPLLNFTAQPRGPRTLVWVVPVVLVSIFLCCLIMLLFMCCCCYYRRNSEISYYPGKTKGRQLTGESPTSMDTFSVEYYEEDIQISDLKYV